MPLFEFELCKELISLIDEWELPGSISLRLKLVYRIREFVSSEICLIGDTSQNLAEVQASEYFLPEFSLNYSFLHGIFVFNLRSIVSINRLTVATSSLILAFLSKALSDFIIVLTWSWSELEIPWDIGDILISMMSFSKSGIFSLSEVIDIFLFLLTESALLFWRENGENFLLREWWLFLRTSLLTLSIFLQAFIYKLYLLDKSYQWYLPTQISNIYIGIKPNIIPLTWSRAVLVYFFLSCHLHNLYLVPIHDIWLFHDLDVMISADLWAPVAWGSWPFHAVSLLYFGLH